MLTQICVVEKELLHSKCGTTSFWLDVQALVVRIALPGLKSAAGVVLDVSSSSLQVLVQGRYKLQTDLPYAVEDEQGTAKFEKQKQQLVVTLPVDVSKLVKAAESAPVAAAQPGCSLTQELSQAEAAAAACQAIEPLVSKLQGGTEGCGAAAMMEVQTPSEAAIEDTSVVVEVLTAAHDKNPSADKCTPAVCRSSLAQSSSDGSHVAGQVAVAETTESPETTEPSQAQHTAHAPQQTTGVSELTCQASAAANHETAVDGKPAACKTANELHWEALHQKFAADSISDSAESQPSEHSPSAATGKLNHMNAM